MKLCFKILILSYSGEVMIIIIPGRPWLGYASEHIKRPSSYDGHEESQPFNNLLDMIWPSISFFY